MQHTEKDINRDVSKLHCHRLLSPSVFSCPLFPFLYLFIKSFPYAQQEILSWIPFGNSIPTSNFPVSFLKGIIVHCSIYRPVCVCVFRYHSSEIAPSKGAPGAREAPDSALTRMSTSTLRDSPANDYHTEYRMRLPYAQKSEMRGRRRAGDSRRGRGEGNCR